MRVSARPFSGCLYQKPTIHGNALLFTGSMKRNIPCSFSSHILQNAEENSSRETHSTQLLESLPRLHRSTGHVINSLGTFIQSARIDIKLPCCAVEGPNEQIHRSFRNWSGSFPRPQRSNKSLSLFETAWLEKRQLLYQSLRTMQEHSDSGKSTGEFRALGEILTIPHNFIRFTPFIDNTQGWKKHQVCSKRPGVRKNMECLQKAGVLGK
jgi:hypothetical protein